MSTECFMDTELARQLVSIFTYETTEYKYWLTADMSNKCPYAQFAHRVLLEQYPVDTLRRQTAVDPELSPAGTKQTVNFKL